MRIGLFGGSFNPIHYGHLILAQEALLEGGLDRIWLLPNGRAPHKDASAVACEHRLAMARLAAGDHPRMEVSSLEIDRPGLSYTYQTLETLVKQYPEHRFSFITGADALLNYKWRNFEGLLGNLEHFLVATRQGVDFDELTQRLTGYASGLGDRIVAFRFPALEISSTMIRERVMEGRSIRFWVPLAVEEYISSRGLYSAAVNGQPAP